MVWLLSHICSNSLLVILPFEDSHCALIVLKIQIRLLSQFPLLSAEPVYSWLPSQVLGPLPMPVLTLRLSLREVDVVCVRQWCPTPSDLITHVIYPPVMSRSCKTHQRIMFWRRHRFSFIPIQEIESLKVPGHLLISLEVEVHYKEVCY